MYTNSKLNKETLVKTMKYLQDNNRISKLGFTKYGVTKMFYYKGKVKEFYFSRGSVNTVLFISYKNKTKRVKEVLLFIIRYNLHL